MGRRKTAATADRQKFPGSLVSSSVTRPNLSLQTIHEGSAVWIIPEFLSHEECNHWIKFAEKSGGLEYTAHPASMYIAHRQCYRMQDESNSEIANKLYLRLLASGILDQLKQELSQHASKSRYSRNDKFETPMGFNPNIRFYKYTKGHSFGKHVDGADQVQGMGQTEITVLIYLSECGGGATRFYPPFQPSKKKKKKNQKEVDSFAFDPKPGTMLLHVHGDDCLEHEADEVTDGIKYVLRTDVVFA
mmetsp:Transcript_841/g.1609  ORF Transcript_841/g.1609 Transcript_841/m.1609 type:complete len:246 (+) Transcript_841:54-791(+)